MPGNNASTADEVSEHSVLGLIWHRGSTPGGLAACQSIIV